MRRFSTLLALVALAPLLTACGPSPEDACAHIIDLMQQELDAKGTALAEDKVGEIQKKCVERANKSKEMKGSVEYKKEAKCVMAAQSVDAAAACSDQADESDAAE